MSRLLNVSAVLVFFLTLVLSSCSKDDYTYPSVQKEMVTAEFTQSGGLSSIITDDGVLHRVSSVAVPTSHVDSTSRVICNYEMVEGTSDPVIVHSVTPVYCQKPVLSDDLPELWEDDITVQSIWKGNGYLNMALEVLSTGRPHDFRFVDFDHRILQDGSLRVDILLDHDMRENKEGYTQLIYASLPVADYFMFARRVQIRIYASLWEGEPYEFLFEK